MCIATSHPHVLRCGAQVGVFANIPVGIAPGMGLNAYLVFSQVGTAGGRGAPTADRARCWGHAMPCLSM